MNKRRLGRTGFDVSVLGFGAAPLAYLKTERDRAADVINELLDAGVNLIDTAASYPGSEQFMGENFGNRRDDFVLVSKCGMKIPQSDALPWSADLIAATIDRSLKFLRTDRLDVMLLHSCGLQTLETGEAVGALANARDAGKIRFAGYSGDNDAAALAATLPDIAVIETSVNIVDQANIERVLPLAVKHDCGVIAKRPIANAAWRGAGAQGIYKEYVKPYVDRLASMKLTPADFGFTGDPNEAWTELALRFTLSFPEIHTAIVGTTDPQHALRNLEFADNGPLPADAIETICTAFRHADPNGRWLGQG